MQLEPVVSFFYKSRKQDGIKLRSCLNIYVDRNWLCWLVPFLWVIVCEREMASESVLWKSGMVRGREEVYVAAMPLRATKGPPQQIMSAAYSLNFWDFQHFMVIIKPSPLPQVLVFDFQPKDPEDIYVALATLSGRAVPG